MAARTERAQSMLTKEMFQALKDKAASEDRSVSDYLRILIERDLKK